MREGATAMVPLLELAHARSGDKGNTVNVGLIAYDPRDYPLIVRAVTAERVAEHFAGMVRGKVERFELPNLHAVNFLLHDALDGGGTVSLMTDAQGKVFSTALLRMEVETPTEVARRVRGQGRVPPLKVEPAGAGALVLQRETPDGVVRLLLNRPERRNALSAALVAELRTRLDAIGRDSGARVVALTGAGPDFCAGADLGEIAASQREGPEAGLADADRLGGLFVAIRRLPLPVVAVVRGRALGGGCGLATACDLVVAAEDAGFGYPEVRLGFVPALVMSLLRGKVGESAALELLLRARRISAERAAAIGLVNRVLPGGAEFEAAAASYLAELAARPPGAMALTKRLFHGLGGASLEDAVARGAEVNAIARLTEDCRRGVAEFLSRDEG